MTLIDAAWGAFIIGFYAGLLLPSVAGNDTGKVHLGIVLPVNLLYICYNVLGMF